MAPLATAYIRLRSDSSTLAGDVRRDATKAGAEGGAVMGREFGTAFRRVSRTLIGLGIGTFAVEAGRFAIDMADKFEASRARVENITKNLGGDFSTISGQVQSLDDRMAAFGFTNADVEGSFASLESVTKSTGQAFKDTALAADIARGRGISLAESTSILMRVETGHVAMLSRLGIATKDSTGHLLTQGQALDMLRAKYQDAASTFSKTSAGEQAALRAQIGNSAAQIGAALLPAAVDLARVLQHDVLPAVQHTTEFFDRNRKTIEPLVGLVLKLALAYKAVKLAQSGLKALAAFRGTGAAVGATEAGVVGRGATPENPLYVFVTNQLAGKGTPPIVATTRKAGKTAPEAAAAEETAGIEVGAGLAGKPVVGFGSLKLPSLSGAAAAAINHATALIQQLPQSQQAAANKSLSGTISQQAGGSFLHNLFLGPKFANVVDTKKLSALEAQWSKLVPAVNKGATSEKHAGQAIAGATASLHAQYKALTNHQAKALALSQGMDDLRSAVHNMAVTVGQESSRALKGNSDAALANRDALRGAVSQAENYLTTLKQHGASAQHVARVQRELSKAIKHNADETYGNKDAVRALLKQLGFLPEVLQHVKTAFDRATDAQDVFSTHAEQLAQRGIFGPAAKKNAKDAGNGLGKSVSTGYDQGVAGVAAASTKAADAAKAAFDAAKSKMQSDFSSIKSFFSQQRETIISGFANFDTSARSDLLGASGPPTPFLQQLNAEAKQADKFTRLWIRLDNEGLNPRLLDMFEGLGPAAIPTMQLWASHPKMRRRADRDIRRIGRDATRVGAAATEDKYGRLIHEDLRTLPKKIGDELRHKLQVTLDTKSLDRLEGRRVQIS